jgi:hypothetical protein
MTTLIINEKDTTITPTIDGSDNSIDIVASGLAGNNKTKAPLNGFFNKISSYSDIKLNQSGTITTNSKKLLPSITITSAEWDPATTRLTLSFTEKDTIPEQFLILLWADNKEHFPLSIGAKPNLTEDDFTNDNVFPNNNNYGLAGVFPETEDETTKFSYVTKGNNASQTLIWDLSKYKYCYCNPIAGEINKLPDYSSPNGIIVPRRICLMSYDGLLIREVNKDKYGNINPVYHNFVFNQGQIKNGKYFGDNEEFNIFDGDPNSATPPYRSPSFLQLLNLKNSSARNNKGPVGNRKSNIYISYDTSQTSIPQFYYSNKWLKMTNKYSWQIFPSLGYNKAGGESNMNGLSGHNNALYVSTPLVSNTVGQTYNSDFISDGFSTSDESTDKTNLVKQVKGTKEILSITNYESSTGAITFTETNCLLDEEIHFAYTNTSLNGVLEHIKSVESTGPSKQTRNVLKQHQSNTGDTLHIFTIRNFKSECTSIAALNNLIFIYTPYFSFSGCGWPADNIYWVSHNYEYVIRVNYITGSGKFILSKLSPHTSEPANIKQMDSAHLCSLSDIISMGKPSNYPASGDYPIPYPLYYKDGSGWSVSDFKLTPSVLSSYTIS